MALSRFILIPLLLISQVMRTLCVYVTQNDQSTRLKEEQLRCLLRIVNEKPPADGREYCEMTWDGLICWGFTPAGQYAVQGCPDYVNQFLTYENASRFCTTTGKWYHHEVLNKTWSNYSSCVEKEENKDISDYMKMHLSNIRLMYTIGYSVSLLSLVTAVIIMVSFRRLHCTRNTIHTHMFMAFIVRSTIALVRDNGMVEGLGFRSDVNLSEDGSLHFLDTSEHWECKLFFTFFNYSIMACYAWIFIEGLYLYILINIAVFSEHSNVRWFIAAGWCSPIIPLIPWVVLRIVKENELCWNTHPTRAYFWVLKGPIVVTILGNFYFFVTIVRVLFTKLVAANTHEARKFRYRKLAKSTLVLIPLFGVHYIVFLGLPDEVQNEHVQLVKLAHEMFFNSFQGFFVAVLFCFMNGEVQSEFRKRWSRHQLSRDCGSVNSNSIRHTMATYVGRNSIPQQQNSLKHQNKNNNGNTGRPISENLELTNLAGSDGTKGVISASKSGEKTALMNGNESDK